MDVDAASEDKEASSETREGMVLGVTASLKLTPEAVITVDPEVVGNVEAGVDDIVDESIADHEVLDAKLVFVVDLQAWHSFLPAHSNPA